MKYYKLLKDLPLFDAGKEGFYLDSDGNMVYSDKNEGHTVIPAGNLVRYPHILTRWFEEIPETSKTVWDLKIGDAYYIPDWDGQVGFDTWLDRSKDLMRRTLGNCFLTKEEAEKELARRKAKQIILRDMKGFKPDWNDSGQNKTLVYYDSEDKKMKVVLWSINAFGGIYFATKEDAEASIRTHEKEWKIYLGAEE